MIARIRMSDSLGNASDLWEKIRRKFYNIFSDGMQKTDRGGSLRMAKTGRPAGKRQKQKVRKICGSRQNG